MTARSTNTPLVSEGAVAARWTARVALAFSGVVLALMLMNAVLARSANPIRVASLEALQHELTLRPNDEALRTRVRREDARIRREYFRHRDFAIRGAWLLLLGIAVYLVASEMARRSAARLPVPNPDAAARHRQAMEATYRAMVGVGGLLGGALLILSVLARHDVTAEYVRAASRIPSQAARVSSRQELPGQAAAAGLAIAGTIAAGERNSSVAAIPRPSGGTLSGPGTKMVPLRAGPAGVRTITSPSSLLKKPLPKVEPLIPPGWESQWPRFRGPGGVGIALISEPPAQWNGQTGQGVLWRTRLPLPGWNSPVVWGDRIYCCGAEEKQREIWCINAQNGAILWRTPVPIPAGTTMPRVQADTGYAPATVATDGARVVAVFVNGDVACVDTAGKLLWTRSMGPLENPYGHASSPVIFGSGVILQLDQGHSGEDGKSALIALDIVTGKTVWQIKRPVGASWSTPILITVNGKEQLITTASPWVIAYDPHNGEELWRADCLGGEVAVSPVLGAGHVLVANLGSNSAAIRPDGRGDVTKQAVAWTAGDGLPDIVSPVVWNDLMLLVTTDGFLTCVEVKTGKKVWEADLEATVRASPVLAGDRIYLLDASGTMHILKAGRSFERIVRCPTGEEANATPAFVGNRVIIRTKQHIFCVGRP